MLMPRYMGLNDGTPSSGNRGPVATKTSSGSSSSSGSPPTTVAAHTKMRLLSKVEHNMRQSQGQSGQDISSLLHTASTGNGVVGDVDGLLTPMRIKAHLSPPRSTGTGSGNGSLGGGSSADASFSSSSALQPCSRPERNLWSRAEMLEMLSIMQNMNALDQLSDRNLKSEHVFRQIEEVMRSKGYVKKSSIQIWTKWKFLKSTYNTTTRHGTGIPKVVPEEVYRVLCRMLSNERHSTGSGSNNVSGSLSECGNSMDSSKTLADDSKEDILGVEHPIFGFRLGLIKPEPVDTGYETNQKAGMVSEPDLDSFEYEDAVNRSANQSNHEESPHIPFIVSVKHEPDMDLGMDGTNTPPPTAPASPSPPPVVLDEHDDDPAYMPTPTSMPPLRVAAFAKDEVRRPSHGILQIDRPLPTLAKMGQNNRSVPLQSTSSINFVHPTSKLMLPRKQNPNASQIGGLRLPRDFGMQSTGMRMKSLPMRETGYSLRPDRMIPDLDQSLASPPHSPPTSMKALLTRGPPPKYPMAGQQVGASTSRQAHLMSSSHQLTPQQHHLLQSRKRRLGPSPVMGMPVPVKLQRSSTMYEPNTKGFRASQPLVAEEGKKKSKDEETKERQKRHEELFATELTQLATSLRSAQKEMLEEFFKQQREFARREHEFQMKQDTMVMRALRTQTHSLLKTAKALVGEDLDAPKSEPEAKDQTIPGTRMPHEPETHLGIPENQNYRQEEILGGDEEGIEEDEDADLEEAMLEDDEDDEDENEDDEDEEEDEDGENENEDEDGENENEDEENLENESDVEMSNLAMSASALSEDYSNHDEVPHDIQ
ncbi:hypothetical protein KR009_009939 [Drosophila setifemur]|nr:hypothetical protein KR009_009939 [Drosophila setifemur]